MRIALYRHRHHPVPPAWTLADTLAGIPRLTTPDLVDALEDSQQTGMPEYGWSTEHVAVHAALQTELARRAGAA